jgi:DNA-binding NarL/FixJ family response regulator
MPGVDGLTALRALRQADIETKVIALSGLEDPELVARVLRACATAFIMKRTHPADLGAAIRQALDQTVYTALPEKPELAGGNGSKAQLNERELEILHAVGEGLSNKQIAERAWLAEQTVKFHLTHIYRKLGVSSRTEAVAAAYRSGLIEDLFAGARESVRTTSS